MALTGTSRTVVRAKQLRRDMSLPEVLLWKELKKRPGGHKFRRQHPAGIYILDFVCMAAKLAIEVDGAFHDAAEQHCRDVKRDKWLAANGYRTVRIAAGDVMKNMDNVISYLMAECSALHPLHHQPEAGGPSWRKQAPGLFFDCRGQSKANSHSGEDFSGECKQ